MALYTIGAMFGALSCIWLGNHLGRRRTIFLASAVTIIGAVLMASSFSLAQFIVARLVVGLGTGGTTATVPVWQSEISKSAHRGAHVVSEGIFIGGGIALALWIDFALYFVNNNSVAWRFPLALQIVFGLMVMTCIFIMPEVGQALVRNTLISLMRNSLLDGFLPKTERTRHARSSPRSKTQTHIPRP